MDRARVSEITVTELPTLPIAAVDDDMIELSILPLKTPEDGSTRVVSPTSSESHLRIANNEIQVPRDETMHQHQKKGRSPWAWPTLISAAIVQFSVAGYTYSYGVFQDYYVREYLTTYTSSEISWIGSVQSFSVLTTGLFAGHLFDKGYFYPLIYTGMCIYALCLFMLSLARPEHYYQIFLTQAIGIGIGGGLFYTPALAVLAQHFPSPNTCARAMAIAAAGGSIGGVVQPILLNQLLLLTHRHREGEKESETAQKAFARANRANASLIVGLLFLAACMMRSNYQNVDAWSEEDREKAGHGKRKSRPSQVLPLLKRFASDWPYVFFVIGMTLYEIVFFFPSFYIQLKAVKQGLDPTFAFYSLVILNGVAFFGRAMPGFFVRSLGVANMFLTSVAAATILIFSMLVVKTYASVTVFAAFYGFFSGTSSSLLTPMLALLAESPAELGARIGTCFAFAGIGSLTGTPITGALLTSRFIWWRPVIFSGVICASAFALFTVCRIVLGKRKGSFWVV